MGWKWVVMRRWELDLLSHAPEEGKPYKVVLLPYMYATHECMSIDVTNCILSVLQGPIFPKLQGALGSHQQQQLIALQGS
jgi:hypothetical protein